MTEDLKNGEVTPGSEGQEPKSLEEELSLEPPKGDEDDTETLKAKLAKAEEDRDNYKKGMLKYKQTQKGEVVEEEGEEEEGDEEKINLTEVRDVATKAASEMLEKANEKSAITEFTNRYPALKDPVKWREVLVNYSSRSGKGNVESITKDLEAALVLAKHYGGGKIKGEEITLSNFGSISNARSIASGERTQDLSDSTIEMGRFMGNSAEELKNASEPGANEIQL